MLNCLYIPMPNTMLATRKQMMKKYGIAFILAMITVAGCITMSPAKRVYAPVDYGAVPDGQTLCTAAIQKAVDECSANGGGVVRLSGGKFLSGTIFMKSNVTLEIAKGSTLLGSANLADYPVTVAAYRSYTDKYTDKSLIYGEGLSNIAITGKGTYDGQGSAFKGPYKKRPYGIRFISCTNVTMENITLKNSPMWMQHYLACDDVTIRNITVWNHCNKNNDMIDIDGCHNVLISGCVGDTDDDGITLKSTSARACENVTIRDCTVSSHCNAVKCGTESNGGFKDIKISHCTIKPSAVKTKIYGRPAGKAGIALEIVDGGVMENINVSDIDITGTAAPIFVRLGDRGRRYKKDMPRPKVGKLHNVTISDIKASTDSDMGCAIAGLKDHPIENLALKNINISFPGGGKEGDRTRRFDEKPGNYPECTMFTKRLPAFGLYCWHVEGLKLENVELTTREPDERTAIVLEDVSNVLIDGKRVDNPALGDWRPFKESSRGFDPRANLDLVPNAEFEVGCDKHGPIVRVNMLKIKDWTAVPGVKKAWKAHYPAASEDAEFSNLILSEVVDVDGRGTLHAFACINWDQSRIARYDDNGKCLWVSDKHLRRSGDESRLPVLDLDGDGTLEVVSVSEYTSKGGGAILCFDSETGKLKWQKDFEGEYYKNLESPMAVGHFSDRKKYDIAVRFGTVVYCMDANGKALWKYKLTDKYDYGHEMYWYDIDGDGLDEIFVNTNHKMTAFRGDGTILWQDNTQQWHSDFIGCADVDDDGRIEVMYDHEGCSHQKGPVYIADALTGNIENKIDYRAIGFPHAQGAVVGKFRTDLPGMQVFMNSKGSGICMFDYKGKLLWEKKVAGCLCASGDWDGDGVLEAMAFGLGTNREGIFSVWDGYGNRKYAISFLPSPVHTPGIAHAGPGGRIGRLHQSDITGDGKADVVMSFGKWGNSVDQYLFIMGQPEG